MEKDREEKLLDDSLQRLKSEKMDWDFGDFLKKTEEPKIVPLMIRKKSFGNKFFFAAAAIVLIFGSFFIVKFLNEGKSAQTSELVKNEIIKQKNSGKLADTLPIPENSVAQNDTIKRTDKPEIHTGRKIENNDEAEVLNKILPRRGRLKKPKRELLAAREMPEKNAAQDTSLYRPDYVTVNGQQIDNEKEAIKITRGALNRMSAGLSKTLTEVDFQDDPGN